MLSKAVSESITRFINDMGNSLSYWTSYIASVKRGPILQESAVRYAISEFLEVNKHNDVNLPVIDNYIFEQPHPYYKDKRTDLYFKVDVKYATDLKSLFTPGVNTKPDSCQVEFSMEFKYVRAEARDTNGGEFKRYLHDVCRLSSIVANDPDKSRGYFVVVGDFDSFYKNFCSITPKKRGRKKKEYVEPFTYNPNGQYSDLLGFRYRGKKTIELSNYSFISKSLAAAEHPNTSKDSTFFKLDLDEINKLRKQFDSTKQDLSSVKFITNNDTIDVKLVYSNLSSKPNRNDHPDVCVCIWEVSAFRRKH